MKRLSAKQIRVLAMEAKVAFRFLGERARQHALPWDASAAREEDWRHEEVFNAVGKRGLRACGNDDLLGGAGAFPESARRARRGAGEPAPGADRETPPARTRTRLLSKSNLLPKVAEGLSAGCAQRKLQRLIFGVSTGTFDDRVAAAFEQGCPLVSKRLASLHWPLWLLRLLEERAHAELVRIAREAFANMWCCSVTSSWTRDVLEFVETGNGEWWRYQIQRDRLVSRYRNSGIWLRELDLCRELARALRRYAAVLHRLTLDEIVVYHQQRRAA